MDVFVLVVDGAVEAQFIDQEFAFVGPAGNAHHATAFDLGDLPGDAAHCTGGT
ncbi:hypothetical protein D3C78_1674790 [compost metagenome]